MGTKINTTYYGLESSWGTASSWGDDCKRADSQHKFLKLAQNGDIDLENEGNIDFTAIPWGVPRCSATSYAYTLHCSMDAGGTYLGTYYPVNDVLDDKNNPLVLVSGAGADISYDSGGTATTNRKYQAARMIGHTDLNNSNALVSTLPADDGTTIASYSDYNESVITYLNYQTCKVVIDKVYLIDKDSTSNTVSTSANNLKIINFNELTSETIEDKWQCFGFTTKFIVNNNLSSDGTLHPAFANKHKVPIHIKNNYSGGAMKEWVQFNRNTIKSIGRPTAYNTGISNLPKIEDINVIGNNTSYTWGVLATTFCNVSPKNQVFDDVSYSWDMLGRFANGGVVVWYKKGTGIVASTPKVFNILKLDDNTADNIDLAIKHEVAFLGFPFVQSVDDIAEPIGSNKVFLPVFDYEHMITTGKYVRGADALQLNNALWGNIFDDNIPNWDPTYEPPDEEQSDEDRGDLTNSTRNRYSNAGGLAQWVVTQQTLLSLQAFLNGTYLPTAEDLDADFKGTNPQQYIVSVQKYPYDIPYQGTSGTIYIGRNSTSLSGYKLFADWGGISVLPINAICTEDFGTIQIPRYYDDFRDYLSKIILFLPFIGTVELDPRLYIGHSVGLIYTIDYNTGNVSAEIKRDGLTMETKNGTISITIPFMAADMGAYQNQLAQLDYSKEMTKIKGVQTALSTGFQIGSAAMSSAASGSLPGLGNLSAIAAGATQLAANATTLSQIDYQIEHTAPNVGTLSTASAANSWFMDPRARLVIVRPSMLVGYNAAEYSHTIGNACCVTGKIGSFSGFTQCASAILDNVRTHNAGRAATEQEKQLLRRALLNGIYL